MTNMEIVMEMVRLGYALMNRTAEEMAETFSNEDLLGFLEAFKAYKGIA